MKKEETLELTQDELVEYICSTFFCAFGIQKYALLYAMYKNSKANGQHAICLAIHNIVDSGIIADRGELFHDEKFLTKVARHIVRDPCFLQYDQNLIDCWNLPW